MSIAQCCEETIAVSRTARFPIELRTPAGFEAERIATWPKVDGRLEYVEGRLLYTPPSGEVQQEAVAEVVMARVHGSASTPVFRSGPTRPD